MRDTSIAERTFCCDLTRSLVALEEAIDKATIWCSGKDAHERDDHEAREHGDRTAVNRRTHDRRKRRAGEHIDQHQPGAEDERRPASDLIAPAMNYIDSAA